MFSKKGYNNTISECFKIWKDEDLSYLHGKCYPTILSLPLHREPFIPFFHFISYLTDHQIQILKKRKSVTENVKDFPICNFPIALLKSNYTSNHFNFIVTQTSEKNLWPASQK